MLAFLNHFKASSESRNIKDVNSTYELGQSGAKLYLTAQSAGIKVGDLLRLDTGQILAVIRIDYYLDPADMFIAEVKEIKDANAN